MYMGVNFLFVGISLALRSYWALIPATIATLILFVQTVLEDKTLQEILEGYKEYTDRVCYKLVPDIW
jgi:protein-S-isoprenylcysteine O-methyltransferase Ste14